MIHVWMLSVLAAAGLSWWAPVWPFDADRSIFTPQHKLIGVGAGRKDLDEEALARRTDLMIEAQQFWILRDPRSLAGAQRITSPHMQKLFDDAQRRTGTPATLMAAIAYLESWGDSNAQSPAGPRGVMQIAAGTARSMGLRMIYATRYKTVTAKRTVKTKRGKTVTRTVKTRSPYTVLVRDERLIPERAIPAAAAYLQRLTSRYGSQDWAIFAYHCGEGCVASMLALTETAKGIKPPYTVPKMFFAGDPSHNRELYQAVTREMERDFSPTYYFRVMCAQRLLALYREDPTEFKRMVDEDKYEPDPRQRAPHRLSVWLKSKDLEFASCEEIKRDAGKRLVRALDDEDFFGFRLRKDVIGAVDPDNLEYFLQASPAAVGTLVYIAFETHRLHAAMKPKGETYTPLEVTSLVQPADLTKRTASRGGRDEAVWHCTGQVFDLDIRNLPVGEREALGFVLEDMGWMGYLGFVEENNGSGVYHIGCSPSMRDFFGEVFKDAVAAAPRKKSV